MDTFWYIDPQRGIDGVWMNSLASDKPIYNADFTEMTVKLRSGIFWSDGVEFTADDVVFTTELHMKTNGMRWSAPFQINVASVSAPDKNTVVFKLKKPNSRFHALFTVRWNAVWMMPKHIFEKVADPLKFDFNKPVSLGAYVLHSYDPNGKWFIWQAREDWQRTTLGRYGAARAEIRRLCGSGPARQARDRAAQPRARHHPRHVGRRHVHAGEAVEDLARLVQGLPLRASRSDAAVGDLQHPERACSRTSGVRWALALLIDIKAVSMASYRGAATISAIAIPPTGTHTDSYHVPMEAWLKDFELDTGKRKIKPYNPNIGKEIADMLRPSMGDAIPTSADEIAKSFGRGWWKPDPAAATELLQAAGFTKRGNDWLTPDGKPFTVRIVVEGDLRPIMTRAGSMIAQQWRQFGIDAKTDVAQGTLVDRRNGGDFDTIISWSVETWGGHPDLSFFLDSWHSQFVSPPGKVADAAQLAALVLARARQDHRADPHRRLRRSEEPRARPRVREARRAGDAGDPADGLQRLHRDG